MNLKRAERMGFSMKKFATVLYYLVAVLTDLSALFAIFCHRDWNTGLLLLCFGSAMLCFGGALANRSAKEQQDEENKK